MEAPGAANRANNPARVQGLYSGPPEPATWNGKRAMIKPWIFELFGTPGGRGGPPADPEVTAAHFAWHLDLWRRAEAWGFEGIFFSEHHFGLSYSPSPNLLIATMATLTKTLRLGVMGVVLPYYQPWRVVEEIGMLDQLTNGRLEIGTASGIPQEMARIGLSVAEANARNAEAIAILDAALASPVISHHGEFWNFDDLAIEPRPLQQPSPPKWTTVVSIESARKAARRGSKLCTGFHPIDRIAAIFDAYREEAARAGHPAGPDQLAIRRSVIVAPDEAQAVATAATALQLYRQALTHDPRYTESPVPDAPGPTHGFSVGADEFIAGTGEHVAEQIIAQCRRVGAGHFLSAVDRRAPRDQRTMGYELYARHVIPALRRAAL
jgi:alkanesulfonate monooxygenase SsuD/methylene tetrahydromethanopterin reductase-like flavin-dependent oxidoreductase (luciferase family)